ncbi:pirin family protein [Achromobacter insolitus]|uniref:pirin family protein n=1 Tax=Achromobacter insolitus TaxID=217204 RepID=UPI0027DFD798|nr:pirin family protein [Achromobacter insolitus]MDQ6212498.1 pirin family protein [Achromobacter insolitus]
MIERRPLASLGHARRGWLDVKHHFSFANYQNPARMRWGALRAWNDETIAPGAGFPPSLHADMEIITCVREGALTHEDDLGNRGRTNAGEVQVISAGSGVTHAEFNMEGRPARVFQIWIEADRRGAPPSWGRKSFTREASRGRFLTLASGIDGDEDALPIRSDARVLTLALKAGEAAIYRFARGRRRGYLVASKGRLEVNGVEIGLGDGAAIRDEIDLHLTALDDAEVLLADTHA